LTDPDQSTWQEIPSGDRRWAMAGHLLPLCLFLGLPLLHILAPFLIWRYRRNRSPFSASHALEAFNFQLSLILYALVAAVIGAMTFWGWILLAGIAIADIFLTGVAADRARSGRDYRYPMAIRFVRPR